jgi:hypothetical protein
MQFARPTIRRPANTIIFGRMDRDALARAARRRQAREALEFERDRAAMLLSELEDALAEIEGPRLAAELYAQMTPDDTALVRAALGDEPPVEPEPEPGIEPDPEPEGGVYTEEEVARLETELDVSRRRQSAIERYLELLADGRGA